MKRTILVLALIATTSLTFVSCRETAQEETVVEEAEGNREVERVEVEVEEEENEGVLERTAKEVDQEVNEEIDQEIERIGDDN